MTARRVKSELHLFDCCASAVQHVMRQIDSKIEQAEIELKFLIFSAVFCAAYTIDSRTV